MSPQAGFLAVVAAAFLVGAVFVAVGGRISGRRVDAIWQMYGIEAAVCAWIMVPAWLGGWWLRGALLALAAVASWELFGVLQRLGLPPWYARAGVLASVAYQPLAWLSDAGWVLASPLLLVLALLAVPVFGRPLPGAYAAAALTVAGSLWPGLCLALAARLPRLGNGFGDLVFLFGTLEANDVFAFLAGKFFGKTPLAPRLSPKKTLGGSLGGITAAVAAGAALAPPLLHGLAWQGALLGLGLGIAGQVADLAASAVKREAGVKDYSDLIPTQGGALDLYDAFIFLAPFWYLALAWWRRGGW